MPRSAIVTDLRPQLRNGTQTRVSDTPLRRRALEPGEMSLRAHFERVAGGERAELENPHVEPRITQDEKRRAIPAAVLIAIVLRERSPTVIFTQRPHGISYPGHWVFPGGRQDETDATPADTALREAEEEIGLDRRQIEVLGELGTYHSHSGHRITPVVALVQPPVELYPNPNEVEAISEISLSRILSPQGYFLYTTPERRHRTNFMLDSRDGEIVVTGVTVSLCIGLYAELLGIRSYS